MTRNFFEIIAMQSIFDFVIFECFFSPFFNPGLSFLTDYIYIKAQITNPSQKLIKFDIHSFITNPNPT